MAQDLARKPNPYKHAFVIYDSVVGQMQDEMDHQWRIAAATDAAQAVAILREVTLWLRSLGQESWTDDEISLSVYQHYAAANELFLGFAAGEPAACMLLQRSDPVYWKEDPGNTALYLHKLAVSRRFSGRDLGRKMIDWAAARALSLGLGALRLDTLASSGLDRLYAAYGFHHFDSAPFLAGTRRVIRMERRL